MASPAPENRPVFLKVTGEVELPGEFTWQTLAALPAEFQVPDVARLDPLRKGVAVRLAGLLAQVKVRPSARYLGLHSAADDFHASIPLEAVRERGLLIYALNGNPLPASAGGPMRFFIPDFAACHTHEIDECANVKFVDHLEFTAERGFDNRPHDGNAHEELHRRQGNG